MTFSNPILAGEELVRTGMRSPDYIPLTQGWRLGRDGTADLANVIVRGEVIVTNANGTIHIHNTIDGPIIELIDQNGISWTINAEGSGSTHHLFISKTVGPFPEIDMNYDQVTGATDITLNADTIHDAGPWTAPALLNGWANFGGGFQTMRWRRRGRMVDIQGAVAGGTVGATIFALPAGNRPPAAVPVPVAASPSPANGQVNASGSVLPPPAGNTFVAFCASIAID